MSFWVLEKPSTLQMVSRPEEKSVAEWQQEYPDRWLFLEITDEDEWEIRKAKLVAVAEDPGELNEMCREYLAREVVHIVVRGHFSQEPPIFIGLGVHAFRDRRLQIDLAAGQLHLLPSSSADFSLQSFTD